IVVLDPNMLTGSLLYACAAALMGGIDSPAGAVVGGFIVGVLENLVGAYLIGTELKLTVALVLIVGVLLVRPAGLFGRVIVQRVEPWKPSPPPRWRRWRPPRPAAACAAGRAAGSPPRSC
ncbi:MAG TPA: hypothetical protein VGD76_17345, partial [Ramlibacter sp.]